MMGFREDKVKSAREQCWMEEMEFLRHLLKIDATILVRTEVQNRFDILERRYKVSVCTLT